MLRIRRLYLLEEGGDVGIVPEADESLGILAGDHHIVALVLPAELVVILYVEFASRMALDAHVAGGVVAVVPVEADGEVPLVLLHALLAHEGHPFLVDEGAVVDVQKFLSGLYQHAHFHGNEVEHPGGVAHLLREMTLFFHVTAAPDPFQIAGFGAEGIFYQLGADVGKTAEGHHLQVGPVVVQEIPVQGVLCKEFLAQLDGILKVAVIAAADGSVDDAGVFLAQVGIFSGADAQHAVHGRDVKPALDVVQAAQLPDKGAVTVHEHQRSRGLEGGKFLLESFHLLRVRQADISPMIDLAIEQCRVYLLVPDEQRVDDGVDFLSAFEGTLITIHKLNLETEDIAFPGQEAHHEVPLGAGITVKGNDGAFLLYFGGDGRHEGFGNMLVAARYNRTCRFL